MKKITLLLLLMCFLSEFIFAQTYPGTPVSNPVRTYTQNDTKGVWVIGNGAPIFSPTAKMSQLYFDYIGQKPYFWNGSAWVDWSAGYIISAANGLTETAGTVKIGGPLIEETTIDLDGNDFIISGTGRFTVDLTSNIQLQTGGNFDLLADGKLQTFTLANMEVYAAQDIAIETDDVINIHAINGGSIIVDNNDFVLTATSGDVQINSPGTTAGVVNGIAYKSDIANSVAVTDYGVNTTTAGVPDNGKVWTYNSTTNEMELQTLPSAVPGLNTIGANQLTSGLRDSIVLNNLSDTIDILATGQSNMVNRDVTIGNWTYQIDSSVLAFHYQDNTFQVADPVLNNISPEDQSGTRNNLAWAFSRKYTAHNKNAVIRMVVSADGGENITNWTPTVETAPDDSNFMLDSIVNKLNRTPADFNAQIILWHQGESDVADGMISQWLNRLIVVYDTLTSHSKVADNAVMLVGYVIPTYVAANTAIDSLYTRLKDIGNRNIVPVRYGDTTSIGDAIHFTNEMLDRMGEHYFSEYSQYPNSYKVQSPDFFRVYPAKTELPNGASDDTDVIWHGSDLYLNTNNIRIGSGPGFHSTNAILGSNAFATNATGTASVAFGTDALSTSSTAAQNTAIGYQALRLSTVTGNTAVGYQALTTNSTGLYNTALGASALASNSGNSGSSAFGFNALLNSTGGANSAFGRDVLKTVTSSTGNCGFGAETLKLNTGASNSAFGMQALTTQGNAASNSAFGVSSGVLVTTGSFNTLIGGQTGYTATPANATTTGSYNTFIGYQAGSGTATQIKNAVALGYNSLATVDSVVVLGATSVKGVAIGLTAPTAFLHIKAGTAAASSAPIKLTSGVLNTTAEVGAIEFLTDAFYGTITTGAVRKTFAFSESPTLTGTVTVPAVAYDATTWNGNNTAPTRDDIRDKIEAIAPIAGSFSGAGTATTVFTVTIGATMANSTYKVNVTPTSALSAALFYVTNKTTTTFDVTYLAGLTGTVTFDWSVFQ